MMSLPTSVKAMAIVEALQQQHGKIERMLIAFGRQLAIFEDGGSPDYELIVRIIAYCVACLHPHHRASEKPLVMALKGQRGIHGLDAEAFEKEYEQIAEGARKMGEAVEAVIREAEVPRQTFSQIARDFIDSCRRHMKTEEQLLFPAAINSLRPEDWETVDKAISTATGVACDAPYAPQRAQYQTIVSWDESR
jgi:hemerythrin-like domain-containing protein